MESLEDKGMTRLQQTYKLRVCGPRETINCGRGIWYITQCLAHAKSLIDIVTETQNLPDGALSMNGGVFREPYWLQQ